MAVLDREQLDTLRRQVEEDYRLDIAAIERLQRRMAGPVASPAPARSLPPAETRVPAEARGPVLAKVEMPQEAQVEGQPDDLTGTLRSMFSSYRK